MRIILILSLLLTFIFSSSGQTYQYGKVDKELLMLKHCPMDSNAHAMILTKTGSNEIKYANGNGFISIMKIKTQIKIFDVEGLDHGIGSIVFNSPIKTSRTTKIDRIKGKTYFLKNEKIKKKKLNINDILITQIDTDNKKVMFEMPKLQPGCVIEFEYELESNFINDEDCYWPIQSEIPVLNSQYTLTTPEFYNFQLSFHENIKPVGDVTNTKLVSYGDYFGLSLSEKTKLSKQNLTISTREIVFKNIPSKAIEDKETNLLTTHAKITQQLIGENYPNVIIKNLSDEYIKFNNKLLQKEEFGGVLKQGKFIDNYLQFSEKDNDLSKAKAIYNLFLKLKIDCGKCDLNAEKTGDEVLKDGNGTHGDIMLNYIAALNHKGIKTYPVIMNCTGSIFINWFDKAIFPNKKIIAKSIIDGAELYTDPLGKYPFGYLISYCLQREGWQIDQKDPKWVNIDANGIGKQIFISNIEFNQQKVKYTTELTRQAYSALADLITLKSMGQNSFLKNIHKDIEGQQLDSIFLKHHTEDSYNIISYLHSNRTDTSNVQIVPFNYCNLSLPCNISERTISVNFTNDLELIFVSNIKIPEGYVPIVPQSVAHRLVNKNYSLQYSATYYENNRTLNIKAKLSKIKDAYFALQFDDLIHANETFTKILSQPISINKIN